MRLGRCIHPRRTIVGLTVDRSTSSEVRIKTAFHAATSATCAAGRPQLHGRKRPDSSGPQPILPGRSIEHSLRNPQRVHRCRRLRIGLRRVPLHSETLSIRHVPNNTRGGPCCSRMPLARLRDVRSVQGRDSPASRTPCKYLEPCHGREHDARESASRSPPARSAAENLRTPKRWMTASRRHAEGSAW